MEIIITDGFVFAKLTEEQAAELYENDNIYVMYPLENYRYWEAESEDDLQDDGPEIVLSIQIGPLDELQADYDEATARNNEKRSFTAWLEDKAENLIY